SALGMLTSSQWKLYFSQNPSLDATKACMLPTEPLKWWILIVSPLARGASAATAPAIPSESPRIAMARRTANARRIFILPWKYRCRTFRDHGGQPTFGTVAVASIRCDHYHSSWTRTGQMLNPRAVRQAGESRATGRWTGDGASRTCIRGD